MLQVRAVFIFAVVKGNFKIEWKMKRLQVFLVQIIRDLKSDYRNVWTTKGT